MGGEEAGEGGEVCGEGADGSDDGVGGGGDEVVGEGEADTAVSAGEEVGWHGVACGLCVFSGSLSLFPSSSYMESLVRKDRVYKWWLKVLMLLVLGPGRWD